jgi:hypothetical protein
MFVFGLFVMLISAGAAALVGWENRHVLVHLRIADHVWTAPLYSVLITGALLACWFLLGAAFIQCRVAERRQARRTRRAQRAREAQGAQGAQRGAAPARDPRVALGSRSVSR